MTPRKQKVVRRCPKCQWSFEADKGDNLHPIVSTEKPNASDVEEDVLTKVYDCRNPECMNPIDVYYYRGKMRFELV